MGERRGEETAADSLKGISRVSSPMKAMGKRTNPF